MFKSSTCSLSLAVGVLLFSVASAYANDYTLQIVAKTGDTIGGKTLMVAPTCCISINNAGEVAFYAQFAGGSGVFTQTEAVAVTGDVVAGKTLLTPNLSVSLNNSGTVAFIGNFPDTTAVVTRRGGQDELVAAVGDVISGQTITGFLTLNINNRRIVTFSASTSGGLGIFTKDQRLAGIGYSISGYTLTGLDFFHSLNDLGTIAIAANCACPFGGGIFTQNQLIIPGGGAAPSINNSGTVAFIATFPQGTGVYTQQGPVAIVGDTIGGITLIGVVKPQVNNAGLVVFEGNPFSSDHGVFTRTSLVAAQGDAVGGKTIGFTPLFFPVVNDLGQVAFSANFTDGTTGIVLATRKR